jgi:hypothetical protein
VTTHLGQIVEARDVVPGDRVILPVLGSRVVVNVDEWDEEFGPEPGPRVTILYAAGTSLAFENRASAARGAVTVTQPEAGLKPLRPHEPVAIERRAA